MPTLQTTCQVVHFQYLIGNDIKMQEYKNAVNFFLKKDK